MRTRLQRAILAASAAVIVWSIGGVAGCARGRACVQVPYGTKSCPSAAEAQRIMTGACADEPVTSVDSEGEFDVDVCCYDVTRSDSTPECFGQPTVAVSGTAITATSTTTSATGPGPSSTSSGPQTCDGLLSGTCGTCMDELCCPEVQACIAAAGCLSCVNDASTCIDDLAGAQTADEFAGCAKASCPTECMLDMGPVPFCGVTPPASGACVVVDGQTIQCNPVTGAGCEQGTGCLPDGAGGFACVAAPTPHGVCQSCGSTGWCANGLSCEGELCARLCCDDADCGTGKCLAKYPPVGICVQ